MHCTESYHGTFPWTVSLSLDLTLLLTVQDAVFLAYLLDSCFSGSLSPITEKPTPWYKLTLRPTFQIQPTARQQWVGTTWSWFKASQSQSMSPLWRASHDTVSRIEDHWTQASDHCNQLTMNHLYRLFNTIDYNKIISFPNFWLTKVPA